MEADAFVCVSLSVCVFASGKVATQRRGELGTPALSSLCALGLSGEEFEVEDLRSPARPQPFSKISCLTAYNCATPPPPPPSPRELLVSPFITLAALHPSYPARSQCGLYALTRHRL